MNYITLFVRIWLTMFAIIILGLICRIDVKLAQARVKYIVAVGTIGTALYGFVGIPLEFISWSGARIVNAIIDCLGWMLLLAAAIIAVVDIHTCNDAVKLGALSHQVCVLVKAAASFAWAGFAFSLFLMLYEVYLIWKGDDGSYSRSLPKRHRSTATASSEISKEEAPQAA